LSVKIALILCVATVFSLLVTGKADTVKTWLEPKEAEVQENSVLAFPGCEGWGCDTVTGGRGGQVVEVTRLDDPIPAEPGTFRYAVENVSGPKIIVFRVGGLIDLQREIGDPDFGALNNAKDMTIAGQTAPGDGIVINNTLNIGSNCIVRYIRIRHKQETTNDGIEIWGTNNIIDHCSISWSADEHIGFHSNDADRNSTVQWSIFTEGIKGMLACYGTHNVSIHHNLFAHNYNRNPKVGSYDDIIKVFDVVNNVIYNIGNSALDIQGTNAHVNCIGNYFKTKDDNSLHRYCAVLIGNPPADTIKLYIDNIYGPRVSQGEPIWNEVRYFESELGYGVADEGTYRSYTPFDTPPITTHDPETAYNLVLDNAGATLPKRDAVDERIIQETRNETASITISSSESYYRTWAAEQWENLTYDNGIAPTDTDHDGMPDDWELARDLDPNVDDSASDRDNDGYTNIEEYINGLAEQTAGPLISNVSVSNITHNSATITWETSKSANSLVEYGLSLNYGGNKSSSSMTQTHSIVLDNLSADTLYHFRVKSEDAEGIQSSSYDYTFQTASAPSSEEEEQPPPEEEQEPSPEEQQPNEEQQEPTGENETGLDQETNNLSGFSSSQREKQTGESKNQDQEQKTGETGENLQKKYDAYLNLSEAKKLTDKLKKLEIREKIFLGSLVSLILGTIVLLIIILI